MERGYDAKSRSHHFTTRAVIDTRILAGAWLVRAPFARRPVSCPAGLVTKLACPLLVTFDAVPDAVEVTEIPAGHGVAAVASSL